jgi:hypothetical protein
MTIQYDVAQSLLAAEQIRWQRLATALLTKLLELASKEHLPAINWTVVNAGATLHGEPIAHPHVLRREQFTAWREAIATATGRSPDVDDEHTMRSGETRLVARWDWVSVALTAGRHNDPAAHAARPDPRRPAPRPDRPRPSPMARLVVALIAIHGLGKQETARLVAADLDLSAGRLAVRRGGTQHHTVYLDELTHALAAGWMRERRRRWPAPPTRTC